MINSQLPILLISNGSTTTETLTFFLLAICCLILPFLAYRSYHCRSQVRKLEALHAVYKTDKGKWEAINGMKDRIIAVIGHDLRSPFSSLITLLKFLEETDLSKEQLNEILGESLHSAQQGLHMVDNLLFWANAQRDDFKANPVDFNINDAIKGATNQIKQQLQKKEIQLLEQIEDITIFADKVLVEIVVRNLLNNAMKYSDSGSQIRLVGEKNDQGYLIQIIDEGKGISSDIMEKLNQSATPINNTYGTHGERGSGLGLKLSFEFAQLNNGLLALDSKEGLGTQARFQLNF